MAYKIANVSSNPDHNGPLAKLVVSANPGVCLGLSGCTSCCVSERDPVCSTERVCSGELKGSGMMVMRDQGCVTSFVRFGDRGKP